MPTAPTNDTARPDVARLDPYAFLAVLGKRVIHPGGRRATDEVIGFADFAAGQRVLDIGCGVATTAIEVARRFAATVTAADISPLMLARARANVARAGLTDRVAVQEADILALPYPEASFAGPRDIPRPGLPRPAVRHRRGMDQPLRSGQPHRPAGGHRTVRHDDPRGFLADEGAHALRVCAAALTPARLRKMAWLMPRMTRAVPYLGYVVIAGTKPAT